ncbi:MAG: AMP-binding protein, partial [Nannocystaceae bacterium]
MVDVPERVRVGAAQNIAPDMDVYHRVYDRARADLDAFWISQSKARVAWREPPTRGLDGGYETVSTGPFQWFADGVLNVTESCLDQHLDSQGEKTAILWEGDEPGDIRRLSYAELHAQVCQAANALTELGVQSGDRVIIYMGMVPEAAVAMLACARVGAIHSVVFGGFSADALRDRIEDCGANVIISQDVGRRGGRDIPLKAVVDEALAGDSSVHRVLVVQRTGDAVAWDSSRDVWWHELVGNASPHHAAVAMAGRPYASGTSNA